MNNPGIYSLGDQVITIAVTGLVMPPVVDLDGLIAITLQAKYRQRCVSVLRSRSHAGASASLARSAMSLKAREESSIADELALIGNYLAGLPKVFETDRE